MTTHSTLRRNSAPAAPRLQVLCIAIALASLGFGTLAQAAEPGLPEGGAVISGSGSISQSGPNMTVNTATARTAIDWQRFNVGPDNRITFNQPDGKSVTLNRVLGGDPSKIYGTVTSNGQLILVNPNGIWMGPKSHISASALVASAGFVTDEQAKAFAATGKLDIQLKGLVRNEGQITVYDNGMVALLGAQVENAGVIQAKQGVAQLATGPQATLDFHGDGLISLAVGGQPGDKDSVNADVTGGVHNSGEIDIGNGVVAMSAERAARHLDSVINLGGNVVADSVSTAGGSIVLGSSAKTNVSGTLSARGTSGGSVKVLGDEVNLAGTAKIDASGTQGAGGQVLVGGSYQGKGPEPAAKSTTVASGAQLKANGKTDGGQVVVWSDGTTHFAGSASARGERSGGLVETSGKQLSIAPDAMVDASGGLVSGTWLLDPDTVNIEASGGAVGSGTVAASAIVNGLKTNNVDISATSRINVNSAIIAQNVGSNASGYYSLRLLSAGNVGSVSGYQDSGNPFADAKRNDSGSVYINSPILLKNGHLVIIATGDVLLKDNSSGKTGDAAYLNRAIIDVGKGTLWIKTANTASVIQDANTALIADKLAVQGASVLLDSPLNFAGTLAGKASNGVFHYTQSNAGGNVTTGKVDSPYSVSGGMPESLDGVTAQTIQKLGEQLVISNSTSGNRNATLSYNGQAFDYLVFDAIQYVDDNGNPVSVSVNDSSDYLVKQMKFTDASGAVWTLSADSSKASKIKVLKNGTEVGDLPPGLSFDAYPGQVVVARNQNADAGWGVREFTNAPGTTNSDEIQYNKNTGTSEQMVVDLGGQTKSVDTVFAWLYNENGAHEAARVQFMNTTDTTASGVKLQAQKAELQGKVDDASREYGEANPAFSSSPLGVAANASDNTRNVKALDDFVDRQLGQDRFQSSTSYSTAATAQSPVGDYAIKGQPSLGEFATRRYESSLADGNLKITPAQLTVTANDKSKVYGDADPAFDYSVAGAKLGQSGADLLQGSLGRAAGENVGQYAIDQGGLGLNDGLGGNYTLKFVNGRLQITPATLTVTADDKSKVYGDADPALTRSVSGLKNGDTAAMVLNGGTLVREAGENVGRYSIQQGSVGLNNQQGANYVLQFVDGKLQITPAELTVSAQDTGKVYGDLDPALTYRVSGLKNGDSQADVLNSGALSRAAGENVGDYAIGQGSVGLNGGQGQNYILSYQAGTFSITPATLHVRADDKSKVYGEIDPALTYQVSGLRNGDSAGDLLQGNVDRAAGEDVGHYAIGQGSLTSTSQNYLLQYENGTFSITPATLHIDADDHTKVYGDADPSLTYHLSGLVNGDSAASVLNGGSLARDAGENVGSYGVHQGSLGLNGGKGQNYILTFNDGQLAITPAELTVSADHKTKVYGDLDPGLTYSVSGLKNGDSAGGVLGGSLARVSGENVRPQGYAIGQGDLALNSGNYRMLFKDGTLQITPAPLVVSADDKSKVQGSADPQLTYSVGGLKNGDSADIAKGSLRRAPGEDPGAYGIGQDQAFSAGNNYSVVFRDGTLTITGPLEPVPPPPAPPAPPAPAPQTPSAVPMAAQSPGNTRCTALESPSAVSANYSVSPAMIRSYAVQLICKPRAYGDKTSTAADISDVLTYANRLLQDDHFIVPNWNRSVIPHDLKKAAVKGGK